MRALIVFSVLFTGTAANAHGLEEGHAVLGITSHAAGNSIAADVEDGTALGFRGVAFRGHLGFEAGFLHTMSSALVDEAAGIRGDLQRNQLEIGLRARLRFGRFTPFARLGLGGELATVTSHAPVLATMPGTETTFGLLADPGIGIAARFGHILIGAGLDAPFVFADGGAGWDVLAMITVGFVTD